MEVDSSRMAKSQPAGIEMNPGPDLIDHDRLKIEQGLNSQNQCFHVSYVLCRGVIQDGMDLVEEKGSFGEASKSADRA